MALPETDDTNSEQDSGDGTTGAASGLGSRAVARGLGLDALARLIDSALDGVAVSNDEGCFVYANRAACEIYGYTLDELRGRNFLFNIPESGKARLLELATRWRTATHTERVVVSIVRPSGEEREIELTTVPLSDGAQSYPAAIFRDVTEARRIEREGAALMQIAARAANGTSLQETLNELCRHLVVTTGAVGAAVVMHDPATRSGRLTGAYGIDDSLIEAGNNMLAAGMRLFSTRVIEEKQTIVLRNAREKLWEMGLSEQYLQFLHSGDWNSLVGVPMFYGEKVVGALIAYHHHAHEFRDADSRFHVALAQHAALAVENAHLLSQAQEKAVLEERQHLARELHDSVSQALYSIGLQARSARILLDRDVTRVAEPLDHVLALSKAAMAEMRALIFELRPGALQEEGLLEALRKHAAMVEAREGVAVALQIAAAGVPRLSFRAEEALYRIAQEALHNVVKHARAKQVRIHIGAEGDGFLLQIGDDGIGFDPAQVPPGHLGLGTMRQRAADLRADYQVESTRGQGTTVTVCYPLPNEV